MRILYMVKYFVSRGIVLALNALQRFFSLPGYAVFGI